MAQCVQHCGSVAGLYGMDAGNIQWSQDTLVREGSIYKYLLLHCWNKMCYMLTTQIRKMLINFPLKNVELQCVPPSLLCFTVTWCKENLTDTQTISLCIYFTPTYSNFIQDTGHQKIFKTCAGSKPVKILLAHVDSMMLFPNVVYTPHARLEEKNKYLELFLMLRMTDIHWSY
jgi:hypothetical protein